MMNVDKDISEGDLVYLWWSLVDEKKPVEIEFKVLEKRKNYLKFRSVNGGYDIFFGNSDLESFHGRVRKV